MQLGYGERNSSLADFFCWKSATTCERPASTSCPCTGGPAQFGKGLWKVETIRTRASSRFIVLRDHLGSIYGQSSRKGNAPAIPPLDTIPIATSKRH
jgi:hypothetical protein